LVDRFTWAASARTHREIYAAVQPGSPARQL
jgi:hypothetical protein